MRMVIDRLRTVNTMLLEIVDVYKGSKYEDTCISDTWFLYGGEEK